MIAEFRVTPKNIQGIGACAMKNDVTHP